ncbi:MULTISPECIES: hypothetical protein [Xanthomonas translucens group]|uniref:hypothetical protein n=1 Tax=Xanthomonas translucens group TaxID=3390202 RepID=UPI0005796EAB|nr:hypothetical protein [Xanthomonas translucens]UKE48764.1 hypothetical protein KHA79_09460 [Xanthomonas translucens pv. cerealis]
MIAVKPTSMSWLCGGRCSSAVSGTLWPPTSSDWIRTGGALRAAQAERERIDLREAGDQREAQCAVGIAQACRLATAVG